MYLKCKRCENGLITSLNMDLCFGCTHQADVQEWKEGKGKTWDGRGVVYSAAMGKITTLNQLKRHSRADPECSLMRYFLLYEAVVVGGRYVQGYPIHEIMER